MEPGSQSGRDTRSTASSGRPATESTGMPMQTQSEYAVATRRRQKFRYAAAAMRQSQRFKAGGFEESKRLGWLTNSEVWWRHPVCRIGVTWFILVQDFYIYGEDPVNDSHVGANYMGMGNILGLLTVWSAPTAGDALLKVFFVLLAIASAIYIGRQLVVIKLLRNRWQLNAFYGGEGCLFVVFLTFGCTSFVASFAYNLFATDPLDGHSMEVFLILGAETLQYRHVGKCFQVLSASVDFLTVVMITDAVLQDRIHHQFWAPRLKRWYINGLGGYVRVMACWLLLLGGTGVAAVLIFRTGSGDERGIRWTDTTIGGTSELGRSFLAACIVFTDLLTVLQDWDFPMFRESLDVEVPVLIAGTTVQQLRCDYFGFFLKRLPRLPDKILAWLPSSDLFAVHITGKWLTYGPLLGVMGVDFMCAKTQMVYDPVHYGQYADPSDGQIWMIVDLAYLELAYTRGVLVHADMISWEARHNVTTGALFENASSPKDVMLNSRYVAESGTRYLALIVSLAILAGFCWLLWIADWRRAAEIDRQERELAAGGEVVGNRAAEADVASAALPDATATQPTPPQFVVSSPGAEAVLGLLPEMDLTTNAEGSRPGRDSPRAEALGTE